MSSEQLFAQLVVLMTLPDNRAKAKLSNSSRVMCSAGGVSNIDTWALSVALVPKVLAVAVRAVNCTVPSFCAVANCIE